MLAKNRLLILLPICSAFFAINGVQAASLEAGDQAILYQSIDENLNSVDMADMINGKPLVLVTGSCT